MRWISRVSSVGFMLLAFTCICPAARGIGAEDEIRLTLGEALLRVESENLEVLVNREAVEQALVAAHRERASLFPQIRLEASQVRNQAVVIGRGFDFPGISFQPHPSNRFDARITGTFPLLDPVLIATYRAARLGVEVSEYDQERLLQEILDATARAYLTHLRNLKRFEVIEANIERDRAMLGLAREQFEAGVATRIDLARAEVELAFDRQERLQQETVVFNSALLLKQLLNVDLRASLEVREFVANRRLPTEGPPVEAEQVLPDLPQYLSAQARLDRNLLERKAAGWERFPAIQLFGDYGYISEEAFDGGEERGWTVGVSASLPIFEGFRIRANKELAESRIRATELQIEQIEQEVSADLLAAWQDMRSRLAQIEVAETNVALANEELRLARFRFEEGVADNREMLDAQNRVAVAEDNLVEAVHQYNLSRLEYARSKGDVRLLLADQEVERAP